MILPRQDWDEVLRWPSEYAHGRGNFGGRVRGVSVLEDGFLKCVNVDCAICTHIAGDQPFDGFDTYFRSAIAMGECHGTEPVVDPPVV